MNNMQERSELLMVPFFSYQQNMYATLVQLYWCKHTTVNQINVITEQVHTTYS